MYPININNIQLDATDYIQEYQNTPLQNIN
jgi:hypothetical protein